MPSLYLIKPAFLILLRPIARGLFRLGATANMVTLAAAALSIAAGGVLAFACDPFCPNGAQCH
jgi:CDP-diacylglycerol---glycerol-3-phosphate 3-phosphatidyltransferase